MELKNSNDTLSRETRYLKRVIESLYNRLQARQQKSTISPPVAADRNNLIASSPTQGELREEQTGGKLLEQSSSRIIRMKGSNHRIRVLTTHVREAPQPPSLPPVFNWTDNSITSAGSEKLKERSDTLNTKTQLESSPPEAGVGSKPALFPTLITSNNN